MTDKLKKDMIKDLNKIFIENQIKAILNLKEDCFSPIQELYKIKEEKNPLFFEMRTFTSRFNKNYDYDDLELVSNEIERLIKDTFKSILESSTILDDKFDTTKYICNEEFLLKEIYVNVYLMMKLTSEKFFLENSTILIYLERYYVYSYNRTSENDINEKRSLKYFDKYSYNINVVFELIILQLSKFLKIANALHIKFLPIIKNIDVFFEVIF